VVGLGLAIFAFINLREQPAGQPAAEPESPKGRAPRLSPKPARECF
jgi:hypothetical protein